MSRRRKHPKVRLKWEDRRDPETGDKYAILRWTDPETGRRTSRSLGFVSAKSAVGAQEDLQAALRLQVALPTDSAALRVDDVLRAYLMELDGRPISEGYGTAQLKRAKILRRHLGHLAADRVNSNVLARYVGDRKRQTTLRGRPPSRATIQGELNTVRAAYRVAIEQGLLTCAVPPMPRGKLADDRRPPRRLTEAELAALIHQAHEDVISGLGHLFQALAWTARRPVAVLALEVEDFARLKDPTLPRSEQLVFFRRDKAGVGRGWGPVTEPAREALLARADEVGEGLMWRTRRGEPYISARLWEAIHRCAQRAGIPPLQVYDLRRYGVTRILDACRGQARVAQQFTGHRDPHTIMRYAYAPEGVAEDLAGRIGWTSEPLRVVDDVEHQAPPNNP